MSQGDGEENNAAIRRGNNVNVEAVREKRSSMYADGKKEYTKIGSAGVI
jgi:hypothetical protein